MIRRQPLKRTSAPLRRTPLSPISKKRRALQKARRATIDEVLARDGGCVLRSWGGCWGPLDVDEIVSRGRGGSIVDPENCQTLCRRHHDKKHAQPHLASILGLWGIAAMRLHRAQEVGADAPLDSLDDLARWAIEEFNR